MRPPALCIYIALFLSFISLDNHANEEATIKIVGVRLPGLLDSSPDSNAPYNKVFRAVAADTGISFKLQVKPSARAFFEYNNGQYQGIFPATLSVVTRPSIESLAINKVKAYLFSQPDFPPLTNLKQLKGKRFGRVRGLPYPPNIMSAPGNVELVSEEAQNIRMLQAKRIDAFIGLAPDVYLALEKMETPPKISVDTNIFYMDIDEAFVFSDAPGNRLIIEKLNRSILKLKANGRLKELLGSAYVD